MSSYGMTSCPDSASVADGVARRSIFLEYHTAGGRQRWLTLGQHGLLTPDAARRKALREKAAIGDGDDLTRSDIKAWHQGMSATPYEANRALAYCSRMLSLAATDWELREDNPCIGVKRFPEHA